MYKKTIVIIATLFFAVSGFGREQIIAGKGASEYKIVLPDKSIADAFLERTAQLLQEGILKSTGSKLEIIKEGDAGKLKHGIYIGATKKSINKGLSPEKLPFWGYIMKSDGDNVYIIGREKSKGNWNLKHYRYYELGSCKGVVDFLKKYTGMEILGSDCDQYSGKEGLTPGSDIKVFKKYDVIKIPANLDIQENFRFSYCIGRELSMFYRLANNMFLAPWMHSYGGHSHDKAIPKSLYKKHPEYFAMINGKRKLQKRPMYCLSNKNVQELIYQEMIKQLKHSNWVQLAQTDGFKPCECEACKKLFNTDKWSEKLWILHRNMAERLQKEQPDKKVVILSYADTNQPPESFSSFPENTIIEICKNDEASLKKWQKIKVSGGLTEYVYTWGYYHPEGFTPKTGVKEVIDQVKLFDKYHIKGIYTCGMGELWGLEGPTYYAYGQALKDPEHADAGKILKKYCRLAFGPAADAAEQFYKYLYSRTRIKITQGKYDYNKIDFTMPYRYDNYKLLARRYPVNVVNKLNRMAKEIIRLAKGNQRYYKMAEQLSMEMKYLDLTSALARSFVSYLNQPGAKTLAVLNSMILRRSRWLSTLPHKKAKSGKYTFEYITTPSDMKFLGGYKTSLIRENGNWCGRFYYPLVWNIPYLLKAKIYPGARVITASRSNHAKTNNQMLIPSDFNFRKNSSPTKVNLVYNSKAITVNFICEKVDLKSCSNDKFYFRIKFPGQKFEHSFMFAPCDKHAQVFLAMEGNPLNGIKYKKITGSDETQVSVSAKNKQVVVSLVVPFKLVGKILHKGDICNVGFSRILTEKKVDLVWEPDIIFLNGKLTRHQGRGKLIFK